LVGVSVQREPAVERAPLLDVDGLAARLGVTRRFVRRLVDERRIPYLKLGRLVRFDPAEVDRWLNDRRVEASDFGGRRRS